MSVVRRHLLITFFVLSYALTWWAVPFGGFLAVGKEMEAHPSLSAGAAGKEVLDDLGVPRYPQCKVTAE